MSNTHDVFNQSTPFADVDLYASNRPLRDALVVWPLKHLLA